jgi:hypothetical protein
MNSFLRLRKMSGLCVGALAAVCLSSGIGYAHDLQICKHSDPPGALAGSFDFSIAGLGTYSTTVGDCVLISSTGPGDFTITEASTPNTILTGVTVDPPNFLVSFDLNAHTAVVHVGDGSLTTVTFTNSPHLTGNQGCTPGYFKQPQHFASWVTYSPTQTVGSVFAGVIAPLQSETLLDALQGGGGPGLTGAETILLRAAVAALLNASNGGVAYPLTAAQVISEVKAALASGNRDTILNEASRLDGFNNGAGGCPLN